MLLLFTQNFKLKYIQFDQTEFYPTTAGQSLSMEYYGYLYVPNQCFASVCKLHIALHGCGQSAANIGDVYVRNAGYNQVADLNNFIILYPQAKPYGIATNPNGCWDWWGYTNSEFGKRINLIWPLLLLILIIFHIIIYISHQERTSNTSDQSYYRPYNRLKTLIQHQTWTQ